MTNSVNSMSIKLKQIYRGIAWCLAWGDKREPQFELAVLEQMRQALNQGQAVPEATRSLIEQVQELQQIAPDYFPTNLSQLQERYPALWEQTTRIGLVYGGATKIKSYVFESAKLPDIRGASAILDRINLIDLKAFFKEGRVYSTALKWLEQHFPELPAALIPELIIYSTGGNILAFCPAAYVDDLANAIERRYTEETLTANSCAVGDRFRLLEIRFGLLRDRIEETPWLDWYSNKKTQANPLVQAYFGLPQKNPEEQFKNRKSFNELAGKLAAQFQKRRNGNDASNERPSRRYPPMFETHPYLVRDESDRRNAIFQTNLPGEPWFSETLARKRIVGQRAKREDRQGQQWYLQSQLNWDSGSLPSWTTKFKRFLGKTKQKPTYYQSLPSDVLSHQVREARTLEDIAKSRHFPSAGGVSNGFVAYIYADGNNMGGYIQKIRTPEEYQQFSQDIFHATEESVYAAISQHLQPRKLDNPTDAESQRELSPWVHPFEIITIGGDDVLLIVPADKALEIAKTIGDEFEHRLGQLPAYQIPASQQNSKSIECHRYRGQPAEPSRCKLSMSIGVLITAYDTPIYYAQNLTEQLLKSAKARAKELKDYSGGTVDFLVMKSLTMISSTIAGYREEGLTKSPQKNQILKLYAAPYTLHELGGLLETAKALKASGFPRSQLYQIRSLLEQGKNTAMLNYRYFRVRLGTEAQNLLKEDFESPWCDAKTNNGNLAPWMYVQGDTKTYETLWRELVDLYPFIEAPSTTSTREASQKTEA